MKEEYFILHLRIMVVAYNNNNRKNSFSCLAILKFQIKISIRLA